MGWRADGHPADAGAGIGRCLCSPIGVQPEVEQIEIDRTKSPAQVANGETLTSYGVMGMIGGQLTVCRQLGGLNKPEDRITQITNGEYYITSKLNKEG